MTYATKSPALVAMQALHKALITDKKPGSPWSKTRVPHRGPANHALSHLLRDLIQQGAHFDVGDVAEIDRTCGAYSTTGTFDIEGVHGTALAVGNASADELRLSQTPGDDGLTLPETRKGIKRVTHTRETWAVVVKAERKAAKAERQTDEVRP
jgi:hypothetical protein